MEKNHIKFIFKITAVFLITFFIQFSAAPGNSVYAQQQFKTEHVFLITLDGLRWQELFSGADSVLIQHDDYVRNPEQLLKKFWDDDPIIRRQKLMPFFWDVIAENGRIYGNRTYGNHVNLTNNHFFSYPGYSELLVGYADENINSNDKKWNPNQTILEFVNNHDEFRGKAAAFGSWDVFPYIINSKRSGIPVNAGFEPVLNEALSDREKFLNLLQEQIPSPWDSVRLDAFTHHYALEHIKKYEPRLLYIAYGETDDFAHNGNFEDYLKSARKTDGFISELWEYVQSHPQYRDKTTFIITTDHGRGTEPIDQWRSHGTNTPGSDQIWIAIMGPDTPSTGEVKTPGQLYLNQIAKTAAFLLGLDYTNERPTGEIIKSVIME